MNAPEGRDRDGVEPLSTREKPVTVAPGPEVCDSPRWLTTSEAAGWTVPAAMTWGIRRGTAAVLAAVPAGKPLPDACGTGGADRVACPHPEPLVSSEARFFRSRFRAGLRGRPV